MTTVSATAHLRKCVLNTALESAEPQEPLGALVGFLRNEHPASSGTDDQPQKRRKLNNGGNAVPQIGDMGDKDNSVVLALAAIDLDFSHLVEDQTRHCSRISDELQIPLQVSLESFSRDSLDNFHLSLWDHRSPSAGIELDFATPSSSIDTLDSLEMLLEAAATLRSTVNGQKRLNRAGASFCRCLIRPSAQNIGAFIIEVEIRWVCGLSVVENLGANTQLGRRDFGLLTRYFPDQSGLASSPWSLSDFYDSVHVPPNHIKISPEIQPSLSETTLYPFQQRAVDWLLQREGVSFSETGKLGSARTPTDSTPISFRLVHDATGKPCYVSHLRGLVVTNPSAVRDASHTLRGGILAEEMGLGKTVELIALICYHKRKISENTVFDVYTGAHVKPSAATLIITPPSILEQWKNEINSHAPELRVFHYHGIPSQSASQKAHDAATVENLLKYDIVLTTYHVLSREIHYAKPTPDRQFRHGKQYQPRKSPLVQVSWWRVCLDEAQMVESGVSQAATVARIIPRCNAWAVSGTPLRKDIQDLRGLLSFLRYEPFAESKAVWDRLDKSTFRTIFNQIALRHTKDKIRDELRLPPQKRVVITVPFTAIEEQNYATMILQMCDVCGLTDEGVPKREGQGAEDPVVIERMREWLVRLRQTCLHANVGSRNRRALGAKNGPLRTVDEVLEVMIDQNDIALKGAARDCINAHIHLGHVSGNAKDIEERSQKALGFYEGALEDARYWVKTCRDELALEREKMGSLSLKSQVPEYAEDDQNTDDEEKGDEGLGRVPTIRKTLRSFLELEHACSFFIGTAYFQIKSNENLTKPNSKEFHLNETLESEWYDKAKAIRTELLREPRNRAQREMKKIQSRRPFHHLPQIEQLTDLGGIENRHVLNMLDGIADILNAQAKQLEEWRQRVIDILLISLLDGDEGKEITGDEYEDSTKLQDELYVYTMALRTLVADRSTTVNGLQDLLIDHELKVAENQAKEKKGHAPELVLEIVKAREKLKPTEKDGSLKGAVSATRSLITSLQWRADEGDARANVELAIAQKYFSQIQGIAAQETKALSILEKETDLFRTAMNHRLEYYRQLQHISDSVAPWREELDVTLDGRRFNYYRRSMDCGKQRVSGLKTKQTYLANLRRENQHQQNTSHECIICKDDFEIGVLTVCGHKYCKECINLWWHQHRNCPMCKKQLHTADFHEITFKPSEMRAQEESHEQDSPPQPSTPQSSHASIYSGISNCIMKQIKSIELDGSYGTKIDMIARHLLWIRHNDPGAKAIIFSQFGDFLEVLREALKKWKIGSSSIHDKNGIHKFRIDPAAECFLLDAKSDSSGLNLVNATYVFLCEPLINPAIELQAIARVHRIGQQRATTVFMYLIGDTVEEAIYDISVSRRLEHMGRGNNGWSDSRSGTATPAVQENALDAANSMEMQSAPLKKLLRKKGDGEVVQVDDLWGCLFGKPRKQQRSVVLEGEVGRHLRAEAAEQRIAQAAGEQRGGAGSR
ncbi:uncharacterized protein BDR25DRAFT_255013 [Lindgomyces ingoldianus]|uniref:Uncharacterized protein n=1 Tax=Lindgomyces ingoldianus TaxID=673940 RepID=A0ACB6R7F5_9PLEO|nr:uncharacterized protein BDR25DRAFT_255013 [Lindgomyces ingoldianus]KAF2474670.1 hypothetical protein BDR25DRAFT_255013 [Lindgomyces ingoldianus]